MHRWIYFQKLKRKYQSLSVHSGILTSDDSVETWWIGSLWYTEVDLGLCFLVWSCGLGEVKQLGCFSHWGCHSGWLDHLDDIVIRIRWNSNSQKTWGCDTPSRNLWGFQSSTMHSVDVGRSRFQQGIADTSAIPSVMSRHINFYSGVWSSNKFNTRNEHFRLVGVIMSSTQWARII